MAHSLRIPDNRSLRPISSSSYESDDEYSSNGRVVVMERARPMPDKKYYMDADEAERMQCRQSNMKAIKELTTHSMRQYPDSNSDKSDNEDDRYTEDNTHTSHYCYMKLLGSIPNYSQTPNAEEFSFNRCELALNENVVLYTEAYELANNRKKYLVFEDNFQTSVLSLVKDKCFQQLQNACSRFESTTGMEQHRATSSSSYKYFVDKGMDDDDARACAFVLSFYTGSTVYQTVNRGASLIARHGNGEAVGLVQTEKFKQASMIMYYLIKALANIDFYWGVVARAIHLSSEELEDYKPGHLVTWIQFSSAKKGYDPPENFASRNTIFKIYSLTGRCIQDFSNFPDEEEVLFMPHSTFLVTRVVKASSWQNHIYMRQIELGLCKYSVMWVDDYIFFDWWENKEYMEKAGTVGTGNNVHFIPKASTETALAFLRSDFGQRLKNKDTFRIVTDMSRDEEVPPENAGARLLAAVRELGFNNRCLVFTINEQNAWEQIKRLIPDSQHHNIKVTCHLLDLENYINFST